MERMPSLKCHSFNADFVSVIEKYPEIYNYNLAEYSNRDIVEKAWHEIALKVNFSIEECKWRWKIILNHYLWHIRFFSRCPDQAETVKKLYSLYKNLAFLRPYYSKPRKPIINLEDHFKENIEMSQTEMSDSQEKDLVVLENFESQNISTDPPIMSTLRKRPYDGHLLEVNSGRKEKEKKEDLENLASECKKSRMCEDNVNENEYVLFIKSLLPNLNNFNRRQSLGFKKSVLNLIEEINKDN